MFFFIGYILKIRLIYRGYLLIYRVFEDVYWVMLGVKFCVYIKKKF